ncbi:MAG TPA: cupin domain-containing protein [Myxococcota bacterium]|jgi:mannose-6-phosphate isomerase-like protein (cupin superfamily)
MSALRILTVRAFLGATATLLVAIGVVAPAFAKEATRELALARSAGDAELQWGPCPAFFPAGCQIAALHGEPAQPNADVFFRVPARYDLPAHWHTSPERMVLVSGELHVTYDGQEPVILRPGMYAYGPAKAVHRGRCESEEPCVLFIAFEGPVDATPVAAPAR